MTEIVIIDKQAWESTLNRSMKLQAESETLKDLLNEWVQFEEEENPKDFTVMSERLTELAKITKEVLDA